MLRKTVTLATAIFFYVYGSLFFQHTAECVMVGTETRYTTFDGYNYVFPGTCTYTLLQTINDPNQLTVSFITLIYVT